MSIGWFVHTIPLYNYFGPGWFSTSWICTRQLICIIIRSWLFLSVQLYKTIGWFVLEMSMTRTLYNYHAYWFVTRYNNSMQFVWLLVGLALEMSLSMTKPLYNFHDYWFVTRYNKSIQEVWLLAGLALEISMTRPLYNYHDYWFVTRYNNSIQLVWLLAGLALEMCRCNMTASISFIF